MTKPVPELRDEYLFHLARVCHLNDRDVDALKIADFANYIDHVDGWLKIEMQLGGARFA